ncbi:hypothetical protein [Arthrobacter sp. VKM Ac-2550]|uniref:DinB/UmuC family translesion DNA polymerase n=1 Tax=Crystallibacter permensis TaxID=1938888 RepID=UPI0022276AD3|nr:hypothetical protein [Arthrobacter sp. VKM Ac-2550]
MHQVMSLYAQQAAVRLAKDRQLAKVMTVFACTSFFNQQAASFPSATFRLPAPTADPVLLSKAAIAALEPRLEEGMPYARAGVMLTDLSPAGAQPSSRSSSPSTNAAISATSWGRSKTNTVRPASDLAKPA